MLCTCDGVPNVLSLHSLLAADNICQSVAVRPSISGVPGSGASGKNYVKIICGV